MKAALKLALVAGAVGIAAAYATWPRINDVETGRTPEYPDLQPRSYAAGEAQVAQAARKAIERLPRWRLVGSGSGTGGHSLQAVATTRVFRFEDDVTVSIQRQGGRTRVTVRSKSRIGKADFGQNARNIRAFLAELDRHVS
jgi:uncharacterized protein (DUF1499 family)